LGLLSPLALRGRTPCTRGARNMTGPPGRKNNAGRLNKHTLAPQWPPGFFSGGIRRCKVTGSMCSAFCSAEPGRPIPRFTGGQLTRETPCFVPPRWSRHVFFFLPGGPFGAARRCRHSFKNLTAPQAPRGSKSGEHFFCLWKPVFFYYPVVPVCFVFPPRRALRSRAPAPA
jgi:hypothetical protein